MPVTTALAIFFLIWWVVLFAVLPWGIRSQHEGGEIAPGTDPGAPAIPRLGRKLMWTTLVSALIFAGCYVVYVHHLVTLQGLVGAVRHAVTANLKDGRPKKRLAQKNSRAKALPGNPYPILNPRLAIAIWLARLGLSAWRQR